ncbi:carboxypeptidase M32 [Roseofilum casamattae]|uniref:carboxypeptidase M32 n=1 Tax=Roseofilum casamattae TaxID=3082944 RepID=UPI003D2F8347
MSTLTPTSDRLQQLQTWVTEIHDIYAAAALLYWDRATYMPSQGVAARGRQMALLRQIAHQKMTDDRLGELLANLRSQAGDFAPHSAEASLIEVADRNYQRAVQVPSEFVARFSRHRTDCYDAWARAKEDDNFAIVQPKLEKTLELTQEYASYFSGYDHIADPLIEDVDYGMTVATLRPLFSQLRQELVPIVEAIAACPAPDTSCLQQTFDRQQQLDFTLDLLQQLGYDFSRGRQDESLHPFTTSFSIDDVRITTRVREDDLTEALFSSIHEMGHALYEQGFDRQLEGTPLAEGSSSGVHESQSRLWENLVGRSHQFWKYFYPQLQQKFPQQLADVSLDTFYRAVNNVERSLIRTDADEVTYNLHVMIRFDLELELLEGSLAVRDLPEAWNARYESDLGVRPPSDRLGVLQDIHWYTSNIGAMFQCYTLGNLMSAQLYDAVLKADPNLLENIAAGNFASLHRWLIDNVHQFGCRYTPSELIVKATGAELSIAPFLNYIRGKYSQLYDI